MNQSQLKLSNGNTIVLLLFLPLFMSQILHSTKSQNPQTTKIPPPTSSSGVNPFHHKPAVPIRNLGNTRNNSMRGQWWPGARVLYLYCIWRRPLVKLFSPLQVLELTVPSPASSLSFLYDQPRLSPQVSDRHHFLRPDPQPQLYALTHVLGSFSVTTDFAHLRLFI